MSPELSDARDEAARQAARLRRALGWLAVLVEPGREAPASPPLLTDAQRALAAERARDERLDREATLAAGGSALAPSPAPVRLDDVDEQVRAGRVVARVVAMVATRVRPAPRVRPGRLVDVVQALDWLAEDGPVWVVDRAGAAVRHGALWGVTHRALLVDVAELLALAAERARTAAGITVDRVAPYPGGRCPVCRSRSLELDRTLPRPQWWVVRCISEACRCSGPGCSCGQRVRYEGRRHAWTYAEFEALQAQIERSSPARLRSGRSGRCLW